MSEQREGSSDLPLRQLLLRGGRDLPPLHHQRECAERFRAAGLTAAARMLKSVAAIQQGPAHSAGLAGALEVGAAQNLPARPGSIGGGTVDLAIAELRDLARAASSGLVQAVAAEAAFLLPDALSVPEASRSGVSDVPPGSVALIEELHAFLRDSLVSDPAAADDLIGRVLAVERHADIDVASFANAPLDDLVIAFCAANLQRFARSNRWLLRGADGAGLLHRVAHLHPAGLGPYLTNVGRIVRRSRDVFDLAEIAVRAADGDVDSRTDTLYWVAILSRHLSGGLLDEIIDDLGDLGAMPALSAMYVDMADRPAWRIDISRIARLRDAALDNGDFLLSAKCQATIVRLCSRDPLEWSILGDIFRSADDPGEAERCFTEALRIQPDHADAIAGVQALRGRNPERARLHYGFGSPTARLRTRLRRRGISQTGQAEAERRVIGRHAGVQHYIDWIVDTALPFWSRAGFDTENGRFRERLDWSGHVLDVPHRAMVQARQIYVFAHAAGLGWFPAGRALAETAMHSLERDFLGSRQGSAGVAFSIDSRGNILSDSRDAYTHAFVLFAMAFLYKVNGDARLIEQANDIVGFIERDLADAEHGGVRDAAPDVSGIKRQNPQMHLLEAYLAWENAAPGHGYLARAASLVRLFQQRLIDPRTGLVLEFFAHDWSVLPDAARAGVVEPGHQFEWDWLLHEYAVLSGDDMTKWRAPLYRAATERGMSEEALVLDELGADLAVRKASSRLWPHTEGIKAAAVRHGDGNPAAGLLADRLADTVLDHFVGRPFAGGWIDQVSQDGRPAVDYVPASSLYHLFLAAAEAAKAFDIAPRRLSLHQSPLQVAS